MRNESMRKVGRFLVQKDFWQSLELRHRLLDLLGAVRSSVEEKYLAATECYWITCLASAFPEVEGVPTYQPRVGLIDGKPTLLSLDVIPS